MPSLIAVPSSPILLCQQCDHHFACRTDGYARNITDSSLDPFPDSETTSRPLKNVLADALHDLAACEREMVTLDETIKLVLQKHIRLTELVSSQRSLLAPIRRVPPELLSDIFLRSVDSNQCLILEHHAVLPMLPVSSVCSRWREIAQATSHLWSSLVVRFTDGAPKATERMDEIISLCLKHSKKAPLTLEIDISKVAQQSTSNPAIKSLFDQSDRWKNVKLHVHISEALSLPIFSSLSGKLSILQSLQILVTRGMIIHEAEVDVFESAPVLATVKLLHVRYHSNIRLPWNQIRSARIDHLNPPQFIQMLNTHPRLVNFTWAHPARERGVDRQSLPIITTPLNLSSLAIMAGREGWSARARDSISCLTLPHLTSFSFCCTQSCPTSESRWIPSPFISLINRSSCSLVSLSFDGVHLADTELLQMIRLSPELVSLTFHESANFFAFPVFTNTLFLQLSMHGGAHTQSNHLPAAPPLAPKLSDLTLTARSHLDHEAFIAMVCSRWNIAGMWNDEGRATTGSRVQVTLWRSITLRMYAASFRGWNPDAMTQLQTLKDISVPIDIELLEVRRR